MSFLSDSFEELTSLTNMLAGGGVLPASFRGISFYVPDVSHEAGRRVVRTVFPGRDVVQFEDLGLHKGPISLSGVIIGGDYVTQARRLEAAFCVAGPGALNHPWLGPMQVILTQPVQIKYSQSQLRLVSFDAVFERIGDEAETNYNTLAGLLGSISALKAQAQALINAALLVAATPALLLRVVDSVLSSIKGVWSSLGGLTRAGGLIRSAIDSALSILSSMSNAASAAEIGTALAGVSSELVTASAPTPMSMIAPGPTPKIAAATPGAHESFDALLSIAAGFNQIEPPAGAAITGDALTLAAETFVLADAAALTVYIDWPSQNDALAARDMLREQINKAQSKAASLSVNMPEAAGSLWRALATLKAAVAIDLDERLGRLPAIRTITTNGTMPAFLIANAMAGDDPKRVVDALHDLINRNAIKHGGAVSPGELEVQL